MHKMKFDVWCKRVKIMQGSAGWFLLNQNGSLMSHGPTRPVQFEPEDYYEILWYTGIEDKNGKEGRHKDIWTDGLNKYLVEWNNKGAKFQLEGITIPRIYSMAHFPEGEIIGNAFNNPELLEAQDDS